MHKGGDVKFSLARAAAAIIAATFISLLVLLGLWLFTSHRDAVRRTEERVIAASMIVATNASWIDSVARQALQRIDEGLSSELASTAWPDVRNINEAISGLPVQVKAYVVDENGDTVYSTDPQIKPVSIVDRPYFSELAKGRKEYVSSLLVSRLNGAQIFVYSRRLERSGSFAGAAIVSFDGAILADVWDAVDLGANSTVGLALDGGHLVARYPPADGPVDMSRYVLFTEHLPKAPNGTYEATSPVDQAHRIVAYRKVEGTPFVALSSSDYDRGLRSFWRNVVVAVSVLGLAAAGLLAAAGWIYLLRKREVVRSQQLERALENNQLLLREIHHRVKNNLQAVQSVIHLQRLPADIQASLSSRISAMAAVHEQIYTHDEFTRLSAYDLLKSVIEGLLRAYGAPVRVDYDFDTILISPDNATSLALLTNELVTNSLKYAFHETTDPTLSLSLKVLEGRRARFSVRDNGRGFADDKSKQGMGSRLIKGTVTQLNGTYTLDGGSGVTFVAELDIVEV